MINPDDLKNATEGTAFAQADLLALCDNENRLHRPLPPKNEKSGFAVIIDLEAATYYFFDTPPPEQTGDWHFSYSEPIADENVAGMRQVIRDFKAAEKYN